MSQYGKFIARDPRRGAHATFTGTKYQYHDRSRMAFAAAVQRVVRDADHNSQHGRVRVLMADGKPGPDAQ